MPTKESLQQSMAKGKAEANKQYELAKQKTEEQIKKTQPHMDNLKNQAHQKLKETHTDSKPYFDALSTTAADASKAASDSAASATKAAADSASKKYTKMKRTNNVTYALGNLGELKAKQLKDATVKATNEALIRASELSQSGVAQSNPQYGPSIATSLPTTPS